ncbi:DUF6233 domain-containing protein [Streptomyces phaeochromogenes]
MLQKLREDRGPARSTLHTPDCEEAPHGAPVLDLNHALDTTAHPGTRLCVSCGCTQELTLLLKGFDHIGDVGSDGS